MEFKVLSVLKKFVPEEQFEALKDDLGKFEVELNKDITKYVTANTPNKDELMEEAKKTAHQEVISALNIKNVSTVEQLNEHMKTVKLSSTEQASELTRLTNELNEKTTLYDTEVATRTKMEQENKLKNEFGLIKSLKINKYDLEDDDAVEFLHSKLSKQVNEELPFEEVVKAYQEANAVEEKSTRHVDPRFSTKKVIKSGGEEDGYALYQNMKKKGIL